MKFRRALGAIPTATSCPPASISGTSRGASQLINRTEAACHARLANALNKPNKGVCRYVFQTDTKYTLCMSGTGHAGMEASIANLVEPGETVVVGNKGQ